MKRKANKIKLFFSCITILITVAVLKIFNEYSVILKNQLALLQLNNSNYDYMLYKTLTENIGIINLVILSIGSLVTYLIIKSLFKDTKGDKNE